MYFLWFLLFYKINYLQLKIHNDKVPIDFLITSITVACVQALIYSNIPMSYHQYIIVTMYMDHFQNMQY